LDGTSIDCHTIDSFQGKENDVIILVTTRSYDYRATDDQVKFFADPQRITVALSRARHGLFIVADFPMLLKYDIWQTCLRLATQETPIVNRQYVGAIFDDVRRNHRNLLVDAHGQPFLPPDTIFINRKWHQY
uniref:AAA_12 domain-containing protein n=1 Tax=Anisakis simplex TaxID=6269 RepID=A0A0M3JQA9_ANISI